MAYVVHPTELKDLLAAAKEENKGKGIPDDVLIQWILNNKDIKIMTSAKYGEAKPIAEWAEENMDDLPKYFNVTEDEEGNVIGQDNKPEVSKEDKIKYAKEFNTGEYKKLWDEYMADYNETAPVLERAKKLTDAYRALWREKNSITSKYDSGIGQNNETYQSALKAINDALEYAEKSDELKDIMSDIESNGASFLQNLNNRVVASTLEDMAIHRGSQMNNGKQQFQNWLLGDVYNSKWNRLGGYTDMEDIPELYHKYNEAYDNLNNWVSNAAGYCAENGISDRKKILDMLDKTEAFNGFAKSQKEKLATEILDKVKTGDFAVKEDTDNNNKEKGEDKKGGDVNINVNKVPKDGNYVPSPYRPIKQVTDEMSFGDDVAAAGGNEYLESRNKILAEHMKLRGIKSEEDIDKYLSQYPSWKNAREDWKANTKKILSEKIKGLEGEGQSEDKAEENKEDNVSKEEVNEIIEENKEAKGGEETKGKNKETLNDKINKGVSEFRKVIENPNEYIDKANDFLNKMKPDNESPINNIENDATTTPGADGEPIGNWAPDNETPLNGTEEERNNFWNDNDKMEHNNSLRAEQYKQKGYTVKDGKFYTPSGVLVESNGYNLAETGEWIPSEKPKKEETKKPETKKTKTPETKKTKTPETKKITNKDVENVINAAKSSPVIMGLINKFKK